jgi:broad specificity phosphatase PhoE
MNRLARPAPLVPKEQSVGEIQKDLLARVRPAIEEIWPSSDAPIQDFDVVVGAAGIAIDVRYSAPRNLGDVPINMVLQHLRTKLGMPDLTLKTERVRPPRPARDIHGAAGKRDLP